MMRTYPIAVHKLFNGIVICRLCSFEEFHGTFPLSYTFCQLWLHAALSSIYISLYEGWVVVF